MSKCRLIRMNLMTYLRSVNTSIIGFFFSSGAPYFGPTNTNHTKNDQKNTVGALLRKTAQNALQCTTVHCNVAP